jgi:hypothetical protein
MRTPRLLLSAIGGPASGWLLCLLAFVGNAAAQENTPPPPGKNLPSVSLGAGTLLYNGDVGKNSGLNIYTRMRAGYSFSVEQRFMKMLGVSLCGIFGKIAGEDRSSDTLMNRNFESKVMQFGLNVAFHFDNDLMIKSDFPIGPYVFAGFHYLMFDPYGDLKDKNGENYYYWSDGSIRDLNESSANQYIAQFLVRDYTYETQLKDSTTNYQRSTFVVPVGAGFKLKLSPSVEASLNGAYNIAFSDYLDNVKEGSNDSYLWTSFAVTYNIGKTSKEKDKYTEVDFSQIDNYDSDNDGVKDFDDMCAGTPPNIKVDSRGCPDDDDNDGVPDYRDKEPKSKRGLPVDSNGVVLTDAMIAEYHRTHDSLATEREEVFTQNPSLKTLEQIEQQIIEEKKNNPLVTSGNVGKMPEEFKSADLNKDGLISSAEISAAIDSFFDGSGDFTVERLHRLIDYFFEQ